MLHSETIDMRDPNAASNANAANVTVLSADRTVAYADVTTAESSFDDEVASSEQELIPGYDDAAFLRPDNDDFRRPMSRLKLELFIALARSDPALQPGLQARAFELPADMLQEDRDHLQQLREQQRANIVRLLVDKPKSMGFHRIFFVARCTAG